VHPQAGAAQPPGACRQIRNELVKILWIAELDDYDNNPYTGRVIIM